MFFPLYVDLTDKKILFVGGGHIAARRIHTLCGFSNHMTVVAPSYEMSILQLKEEGYPISLVQRDFCISDLDEAELVFAATDDSELNQKIAGVCRQKGIPVNVCSDQSLCDFQFPSIVLAEDVVIGLNASGKDHHKVKETRQKLEQLLNVEKGQGKYMD